MMTQEEFRSYMDSFTEQARTLERSKNKVRIQARLDRMTDRLIKHLDIPKENP